MTPGKLVKLTESHLSLTELICGPRQGVYIEESTAHGKMLTTLRVTMVRRLKMGEQGS